MEGAPIKAPVRRQGATEIACAFRTISLRIEHGKGFVQGVSLGGNPIDVAYCALWLCSDEASWVTGQGITIDGGDSVFIDSPSRLAAVDQG